MLNTAVVKIWEHPARTASPSLRTAPSVQVDLAATLILHGCLSGYGYLIFQVGSMKDIPSFGDFGVRILMVA